MITSFTCENFRNLHCNDLPLGHKFNILIGPNCAGKSNFIKALSFLANMLISNRNNPYNNSFLFECANNAWAKLIRRSINRPAQINLKWTIELEEKLNYFFSFSAGNKTEDFYITDERLDSTAIPQGKKEAFNYFTCHDTRPGKGYFSSARKGEPNTRLETQISNDETVLLQFNDTLLKEKRLYNNKVITDKIRPMISEISEYFSKFRSYSSSEFNLAAAREPVDIKNSGLRLEKDASNFLNVLNVVYTDIYNKKRFEDKFKELLHNLVLTNTTTEFDKFVFRLGYDGMQFDLSDLSDGAMKALILNLLINFSTATNTSVLAIDEPELNLHPAWQKVVAHWVLTSSGVRQFFISTHSPDFLDVFTEEFINGTAGVYVFSNGQVKQLQYQDIREDLEGWQLGDLYRAGEPSLGGWPW